MKSLIFIDETGMKLTVSPKNYLVDKDNMCYIAIAPILVTDDSYVSQDNFYTYTILGQPFLKEYYTAFNYKSEEITIAKISGNVYNKAPL
jgi:hypothetical protein